ncbi:MAG: sensor histidine kinase, partial [Clostridia bacterium]
IPAIMVISFLYIFIREYTNKKNYYNTVISNFKKLDNKCLLSEVIDESNFIEGKILYNILKETNKYMLDDINKYKYTTEEYIEYIELWIHEIKTPISVSKLIIENNKNDVTR